MDKGFLQNLICKSAEITGYESGVFLEDGIIIACSEPLRINTEHPDVSCVMKRTEKSFILGGQAYHKITARNKAEYILYIASPREEDLKSLALMAAAIENAKPLISERYGRIDFIKSLLTDDQYAADLTVKAREYRIAYAVPRTVFLIRCVGTTEIEPLEILGNMYPNKLKDFILRLGEDEIVLIGELRTASHRTEPWDDGRSIADTLSSELMVNIRIGIGRTTANLAELRKSYTEAQTALEVGSLFENESNVFHYDQLGLVRLFYNLPAEKCRIFLNEIFKDGALDLLDNETLATARKFLQNDLNVSETSRLLFIHRNTLVYRLDKIQKITGLDLRRFEDAVIFKTALMLKNYLDKAHRKW